MGSVAYARTGMLLLGALALLLVLVAFASPAQADLTASGPAGTITLNSPLQDATITNSAALTIRGSLSDPGAALTVNGVPTAVSPSGAFSSDQALARGLNLFLLVASDRTGARTQLAFTVNLDTTPPPLTLISPEDGAAMPDDRPLIFGATEPGATLAVDGIPVAVNLFDGTFNVRDLTIGGAVGSACTEQVALHLVARDPAGNENTLYRLITVDHCASHPTLLLALPTVPVAAGTTSVALDLASYYRDDDGTDGLIFSAQVGGAAAAALGASFSSRTLWLTWSDTSYRGLAEISIVARDPGGEASDPAVLTLDVSAAAMNEPPTLSLFSPPEGAELVPAGGFATIRGYAFDPEGGAIAFLATDLEAGFHLAASDRDASTGLFTLRLAVDRDVLSGALYHGQVVVTDGQFASARAAFAIRVYDASSPAVVTLQVPANGEFTASAGGVLNDVSIEFSTSRTVAALAFAPFPRVDPCGLPGPCIEILPPYIVALNEERTYWSLHFIAPLEPGAYTAVFWTDEPGIAGQPLEIPLSVVAPPQPPRVDRLERMGGSGVAVEGAPLAFAWYGEVPDSATFEWRVDGQLASTERVFSNVVLDTGTHTITFTATSPGGSSSASTTIGVGSRTSAPLAPSATPWLFYLALAGLLVVGLVLGGTEVGIYFLVSAFLGALIDRQQREKLLTHFVRGRIYQIIEYEPGIHLSELQRKAKAARGVCAYHLHALEKAGLVKSFRDGMYLRFTTTKVPVDPSTYALAAEDREFLRKIEARPGISERELSELLVRSSGSVARTAAKLARSGYLDVRRAGEANVYYPRTRPEGAPDAEP